MTGAPTVDGQSKRAKAQRTARRAEILKAVQREFGTRGYHATSSSTVSRAA